MADSGMNDLQRRLAALRSKPTPAPAPSDDSPPSGLARRLSGLQAPTVADEDSVPIQTKNVDDDVAAFLRSASSAPPALPSPPTTKLNAALESYESLLPSLSPIEVYYAAPVAAATVSDRSEGEEAALMARLRDELSLEATHGTEDEQQVEGWKKRMEGLKGVVSGGTKRDEVARGLGAPPEAAEMGELKRGARGSDEESESSESEKTSESEPDSEEE